MGNKSNINMVSWGGGGELGMLGFTVKLSGGGFRLVNNTEEMEDVA